jgi:translation initiation factor 1
MLIGSGEPWWPHPTRVAKPAYDRSMSDRANARVVYSTGKGEICPRCGRPARDCQCRSGAPAEAVPNRVVAKLRVEKAGRGGKTVTVVDGLPHNAAFLKDLCAELKRVCGTGGAVRQGAVELQGDRRDRTREHLESKGYGVKG